VAVLNESFLSYAFAGREGQTLPFKGRAHAVPALGKNTLLEYCKKPFNVHYVRACPW
jgi:hypothetical protein